MLSLKKGGSVICAVRDEPDWRNKKKRTSFPIVLKTFTCCNWLELSRVRNNSFEKQKRLCR